MTDDIRADILNLYERGLLVVKAAGHWQDNSVGQSKTTIVIYDDKYYKVSQKRLWRSCPATCDAWWDVVEQKVVQVVFKTRVKKITEKWWSEVQ